MLLFAKGIDTSWTCTGVSDLSHLTQKIKKHEESIACLDLSVLERTEIRQQLSSVFRQNIERQGDNIRKNRHVLSKIVLSSAVNLHLPYVDMKKQSLTILGYSED